MIITFCLGEPFWRRVGQREVQAQVDPPATVAQALAVLAGAYPALGADLAEAGGALAVFLDEAAAEPARPVPDGARLHLLWAVSGG
jgi:hypothetical protein